jgi:hypothetical protein
LRYQVIDAAGGLIFSLFIYGAVGSITETLFLFGANAAWISIALMVAIGYHSSKLRRRQGQSVTQHPDKGGAYA